MTVLANLIYFCTLERFYTSVVRIRRSFQTQRDGEACVYEMGYKLEYGHTLFI